jgi:antirestriction protein ArdC
MQKSSVYDTITATIVERIESGKAAAEWKMPWHTSGITSPINAVSKKRYRGINTLTLWATANRRGYTYCMSRRNFRGGTHLRVR